MAYGNFIASVPLCQIEALREDPTSLLRPERIDLVSHLLASWVRTEPLAELLHEALDGGEKLAEGLWHPLRIPIVHLAADAGRLLRNLSEAFRTVTALDPTSRDVRWFQIEIERVIAVFEHAAENGNCVVSVLDLPMDAERSARIRIPFLF